MITPTWVVQEKILALKEEQEFTRKMGVLEHSRRKGGHMQRQGGGNSKALLGLASFLSFSLNLISMWLSLITYSKESSLQYLVLFLRINYLFLFILLVVYLPGTHTPSNQRPKPADTSIFHCSAVARTLK